MDALKSDPLSLLYILPIAIGVGIFRGALKKDMENLYEAVVESDGRLRLNSAVHLEKGLKVLVAVLRSEKDSALCGIALSEPSLTDDWLNPEEEEAWAHLQ